MRIPDPAFYFTGPGIWVLTPTPHQVVVQICDHWFADPPVLVVLVDFVFPWGIKYAVVFLPQRLFTLWCLQIS